MLGYRLVPVDDATTVNAVAPVSLVDALRIANEAAEFAESSPIPGPETLYRNVWAVENPNGRLFFDGRRRD